MKKLVLFAFLLSFFFACGNADEKTNNTTDSTTTAVSQNATYTSVELNVEGMTCTGCENTITKSLMKQAGIDSVHADHENGKTFVKYDSSTVKIADIQKIIEDKGYKVVNNIQ